MTAITSSARGTGTPGAASTASAPSGGPADWGLWSNDPDIARVEAECPVLTDSGFLLITTDQFQRVDNHFLVSWETDRNWLFAEALRLRGYDQAGNLVYESPVPESWAEEYNISDPDGWRFRYEAFYSREDEP